MERDSIFRATTNIKYVVIYAFNFFNHRDYQSIENKHLESTFLDKFSFGNEEFDLHFQKRRSAETKVFSGEINLDTFLDSWFGRDLQNLDPNLKQLGALFAHYGPITNNWIANFITSKVM